MGRRSSAAGIAAMLVPMLACLGAAAEGNQLIATVERPATVTVTVASGPDSIRAGQYVVVDVTAYTPPRDGVVQGVVTVQKNSNSKEQEIGRFGIFPNTEFSAADPSKVQRYSFPLPRDVLQDGPVKLTVHVVPLRGEGKGARIEVGGAEIK
jgi:hypothetical protein